MVAYQNLMYIVTKQLKIFGFIVFSLHEKYQKQFYKDVPPRLASGEFKHVEDITRGLENVGDAIVAVQRGTNTGKSVIVVAEE